MHRVTPSASFAIVLARVVAVFTGLAAAPSAGAQPQVPDSPSEPDSPSGPAVGVAGSGDAGFVPAVRSREDYEALSPAQRNTFNRSRRPPLTIFADFDAGYSAPADLTGASGDLSITRLGATFGPSLRISDTADFAVRFETEWSNYDFNNASGLVPGTDDPFGDTLLLGVTPVVNVVNPDGWSWFAGAQVNSSSEGGAVFEESITVGGFASASYPVTPSLRLGFGALVASELSSDRPLLLPVPVLEWWITERLSLQTRRPGLALVYEPAFGWQVGVEAGFDRREFRLDEDGPLPRGVALDRTITTAFVLTYSPHPRFGVSGRVGAIAWGELEFFNEEQLKISDSDRDPALFTGFSLTVRF